MKSIIIQREIFRNLINEGGSYNFFVLPVNEKLINIISYHNSYKGKTTYKNLYS